jgi:hypothetical protein
MLLKNFVIHAFAEVIVADRAIDLHNLYGVANITTDQAGDRLTLRFTAITDGRDPTGCRTR